MKFNFDDHFDMAIPKPKNKGPIDPIGISYFYQKDEFGSIEDWWYPKLNTWTKFIPRFILRPLLNLLNRNYSYF